MGQDIKYVPFNFQINCRIPFMSQQLSLLVCSQCSLASQGTEFGNGRQRLQGTAGEILPSFFLMTHSMPRNKLRGLLLLPLICASLSLDLIYIICMNTHHTAQVTLFSSTSVIRKVLQQKFICSFLIKFCERTRSHLDLF